METPHRTEFFVSALVGPPFGVKGFVKVRALSGETEHLLKLKTARLRQNGKEFSREIEETSPLGDDLLMKFQGCGSPEEARVLTGAELLLSREEAAPLQDGEYYVEDLKGLMVTHPESGENVGKISDFLEAGGGNLAEIELLSGEKRLVPFRDEFFGDVDLEKGVLPLKNLWILE